MNGFCGSKPRSACMDERSSSGSESRFSIRSQVGSSVVTPHGTFRAYRFRVARFAIRSQSGRFAPWVARHFGCVDRIGLRPRFLLWSYTFTENRHLGCTGSVGGLSKIEVRFVGCGVLRFEAKVSSARRTTALGFAVRSRIRRAHRTDIELATWLRPPSLA